MSSQLEQTLRVYKNLSPHAHLRRGCGSSSQGDHQTLGRDVELIDFRNGACPSLIDKSPRLAEKGQIALIAIDASPSLQFHTLLTDLFYAMKSGKQLYGYAAKASVYVCTTARLLDQIEHWELTAAGLQ